jgi:outer membrane protein assembly factor BamB
LTTDHQVVLASRAGALLALDLQGRIRWRRRADGQSWTNEVHRLLQYGDQLAAVRHHTVDLLDMRTGALKSTYDAVGEITGADANGKSMCLVEGSGLHCFPEGNRDFLYGHGVSMSQNLICTTQDDAKDQNVTCLSANGGAELWKRQLYVHDAAPVQDGPRMFVRLNGGLRALNSADGSTVWGTEDDAAPLMIPTGFGLLERDMAGQPVLRDPETGELRRVWPQVQWRESAAVHGKWAAIADFDVVWLLDLSDRSKLP